MKFMGDLDKYTREYRRAKVYTTTIDRTVDDMCAAASWPITGVQALCILALLQEDVKQPKDLVEVLCSTSQTITGIIERLVKAGLVKRIYDLRDRRCHRLELTDDIWEKLHCTQEEFQSTFAAMCKNAFLQSKEIVG